MIWTMQYKALLEVEDSCIWSSVDVRDHDCTTVGQDYAVGRQLPRVVAVSLTMGQGRTDVTLTRLQSPIKVSRHDMY